MRKNMAIWEIIWFCLGCGDVVAREGEGERECLCVSRNNLLKTKFRLVNIVAHTSSICLFLSPLPSYLLDFSIHGNEISFVSFSSLKFETRNKQTNHIPSETYLLTHSLTRHLLHTAGIGVAVIVARSSCYFVFLLKKYDENSFQSVEIRKL